MAAQSCLQTTTGVTRDTNSRGASFDGGVERVVIGHLEPLASRIVPVATA